MFPNIYPAHLLLSLIKLSYPIRDIPREIRSLLNSTEIKYVHPENMWPWKIQRENPEGLIYIHVCGLFSCIQLRISVLRWKAVSHAKVFLLCFSFLGTLVNGKGIGTWDKTILWKTEEWAIINSKKIVFKECNLCLKGHWFYLSTYYNFSHIFYLFLGDALLHFKMAFWRWLFNHRGNQWTLGTAVYLHCSKASGQVEST